jgi:hypothetical protein
VDSKIVKKKIKEQIITISHKIKMIVLQFHVLFTCINSLQIVAFFKLFLKSGINPYSKWFPPVLRGFQTQVLKKSVFFNRLFLTFSIGKLLY